MLSHMESDRAERRERPIRKARRAIPAQLLTVTEAAELAATSTDWWRRRIARREIGAVKLGRAVRLRAQDVARLIDRNFRPAQP
jgi:excisionase family DNA binding protein